MRMTHEVDNFSLFSWPLSSTASLNESLTSHWKRFDGSSDLALGGFPWSDDTMVLKGMTRCAKPSVRRVDVVDGVCIPVWLSDDFVVCA